MMDIVLWLLILYPIEKFSKSGAEGITKESTLLVKGVGAVLVFVHHLALKTNCISLENMNFPAVACFFLVAGYGLMYSTMHRSNYIDRILKYKIPLLIKWSLFSALLTTIFYFFIKKPPTKIEIATAFLGNRILNWFFFALIIHYLIFTIGAKIGGGKKRVYFCSMWYAYNSIYFYCKNIEFFSVIFYELSGLPIRSVYSM